MRTDLSNELIVLQFIERKRLSPLQAKVNFEAISPFAQIFELLSDDTFTFALLPHA